MEALVAALPSALAAYALGCLVGAYYIVRLRSGTDVRATGSGNAGARNVFRSGDRVGAALTLLWDAGKGALAILVARATSPDNLSIATAFVAVIVGHIWPAQLRFHGGKGVAPAIGAALVLLPRIADASPTLWTGLVVGCALVVLAHQPFATRKVDSGTDLTDSGTDSSTDFSTDSRTDSRTKGKRGIQ